MDFSLIPDHVYRDAIATCFSDRLLTQKSGGYNFRCPICGDSTDKETDTNAWILTDGGRYWYHCFKGKCGYSKPFISYLKEFNRSIYENVLLNAYVNDGKKSRDVFIEDKRKASRLSNGTGIESFDNGELISIMEDERICHRAIDIVKARKIPESIYSKWFVAKYDKRFRKNNGGKGNVYANRIIIPFYRLGGKWNYFLARDMKEKSDRRYLKPDTDKELFNIDWIDINTKCFVTEGEIDSCFIDNCVGIGGTSGVRKLFELFPSLRDTHKRNLVFIWDNDEAGEKMRLQTVKRGYAYFDWTTVKKREDVPDSVKIKDINDLVLYGDGVEMQRNGKISMAYIKKHIVVPKIGSDLLLRLNKLTNAL